MGIGWTFNATTSIRVVSCAAVPTSVRSSHAENGTPLLFIRPEMVFFSSFRGRCALRLHSPAAELDLKWVAG